MGLSVPDDDDDDSPAASPAPALHSGNWVTNSVEVNMDETPAEDCTSSPPSDNNGLLSNKVNDQKKRQGFRRQFDVESLLAPDTDRYKEIRAHTTRMSVVNVEEPADIFVLDDDSRIKSAIDSDKNGNIDNRDRMCFENNDEKQANEEAIMHADLVNGNNSKELMHDSNEEKETLCSQNNECDRESVNSSYSPRYNREKDTTEYTDSHPDVGENNGMSDSSSPDNLNCSFSEENGSKNQSIMPEGCPTSPAYFNANNFSNTQSIAAFYNAGKQTLLRPVGQVSRFSLIPTQGLLGSSLDIEAAQRWQQSMATLLMKAQIKGRQESVYQIRD
jgi:hypothetical protein